MPPDAPGVEGKVLGAPFRAWPCAAPGRRPALGLRGQCGQPPVGRIDDQGRAPPVEMLGAAVPPIVAVAAVRRLAFVFMLAFVFLFRFAFVFALLTVTLVLVLVFVAVSHPIARAVSWWRSST